MKDDMNDALERLKDILSEVGELSSEAEELIREYFPQYEAQAEAYGVFQWGWSSNPYDISLTSIVEKIDEEIE